MTEAANRAGEGQTTGANPCHVASYLALILRTLLVALAAVTSVASFGRGTSVPITPAARASAT